MHLELIYENALIRCFLTSPLIQEIARAFAGELEKNEFTVSNEWLELS